MSNSIETKSQEAAYSYDAVEYPSHAYEASHPDQLYTLARLFHLLPTLPENASVLELGCASGGNLIPVAMQLPNARIVGVDLSSKQIAQGQASINALGLTNMKLHAEDFCNIDESYGQFDYIMCHGVFSWVPHEAQLKIFEICRDRLTPNGVAYISYNSYPGWFMRGMIREMMLHHIKNVTDPIKKVQQARALLAFIVASTEGQETPYAQFLKQEMEMLSKHSDAYLFHDHLEENNHPMFFYQFMDMASAHDLQFIGESSLASMITSNLPPKAAEALTNLTTDVHQRSQYTDFVTNRMFRQSLICRKGNKINRHIDESSLSGAFVSGRFQQDDPTKGQDIGPKVEIAFKCPNGRGIKTDHPSLKALMFTLNEAWPNALSLPEICTRIEKRLSESIVVGEKEQISIASVSTSHLLQMLVRGDIEMRYVPDRFVENASDLPNVSAFARLQATSNPLVTNQRHGAVQLDPLSRLLIPFFDGTRTRAQLIECLAELARDGKLKINVQGNAPADMSVIHGAAIDKVLLHLRKSAMLIG